MENLLTMLRASGHAEISKTSKGIVGNKNKRAKKVVKNGKNNDVVTELITALILAIQTQFGEMLEMYNRANFDLLCRMMTDFIAGMSNLHEKQAALYEGEEESDNEGWDENEEEEDEEEDEEEEEEAGPASKRGRKLEATMPIKKRGVKRNTASSRRKSKTESEPAGNEGVQLQMQEKSTDAGVMMMATKPTVSMGGSNSAFVSTISSTTSNNGSRSSSNNNNNVHSISPSSSTDPSQLMMPGNVAVTHESPSTMTYMHQQQIPSTSGTLFTI